MLLSPIPEQPELVDRAPPTGTDLSDNPDQDSEGAYISKKKIKQQERSESSNLGHVVSICM